MTDHGKQGSSRMRALIILFCLAALSLIVAFVVREPVRTGDGVEYICTLQALFDHGTPDVRPVDLEAVARDLGAGALQGSDKFLPPARNGQRFALHFWLYPLLCLPAKFILAATGGSQLSAFQLTNAALFLSACATLLFTTPAPPSKRFVFAALAAVGPIIWYLPWTHPETFTWSWVVIGLVLLWAKRYPLSAVSISMAAVHNPPLVFLVGYVVLLSLEQRRLRTTAITCLGASLSLLPVAFYYYNYGVPSLIAAVGGTDAHLVSAARAWSLLADLNQGILPYQPLLLVMMAAAAVRIVVKLDLRGAIGCAALLATILGCTAAPNWNSAAAGMMRYAVWTAPIIAWLVAEFLPARGIAMAGAALAVLVHGAVVVTGSSAERYGRHTAVASFVLARAPSLYNPDPEIFGERQMGRELLWAERLPLAFLRGDGTVTKVLTDRTSIDALPDIFIVDPPYIRQVQEANRTRSGFFYLNPPTGSIVGPSGSGPFLKILRRSVSLQISHLPAYADAPRIQLQVAVINSGEACFWGERSGFEKPLWLAYRIQQGEEATVGEGNAFTFSSSLKPRTTSFVAARIPLPLEAGDYVIEIVPSLARPVWGRSPVRLVVSVSASPAGAYSATIAEPE